MSARIFSAHKTERYIAYMTADSISPPVHRGFWCNCMYTILAYWSGVSENIFILRIPLLFVINNANWKRFCWTHRCNILPYRSHLQAHIHVQYKNVRQVTGIIRARLAQEPCSQNHGRHTQPSRHLYQACTGIWGSPDERKWDQVALMQMFKSTRSQQRRFTSPLLPWVRSWSWSW